MKLDVLLFNKNKSLNYKINEKSLNFSSDDNTNRYTREDRFQTILFFDDIKLRWHKL